MLELGAETIDQAFLGESGIKTIAIGTEPIYIRPGGYIYITLTSKEIE